MTGCPAWYDIKMLDKRIEGTIQINKIAVSDPADVLSYGKQSIQIVKYLKEKFPDAQINYFFHRGIEKDRFTGEVVGNVNVKLRRELEDMGIKIHNIAYGCEGFQDYDECDLHIGYRVHAHIYNLSRRKRSVLIEEDVRGAGVNHALGLWRLRAYENKRRMAHTTYEKIYNKIYDHFQINNEIVKELDIYLEYLKENDYLLLNEAFGRMEVYYSNMYSQIDMLLNERYR